MRVKVGKVARREPASRIGHCLAAWLIVLSAAPFGRAVQQPRSAQSAPSAPTAQAAPASHASAHSAKNGPSKEKATRHLTSGKSQTQRPRAKSAKKRTSANTARLSAKAARRAYMARLHPGADRVAAIQQKLAEAGYLKEEPNGQWDDQTREAMRRYQEDNGFPATGLPEAKSLMKLGLGPHPLPPELDRSRSQAADTSPSGGQ